VDCAAELSTCPVLGCETAFPAPDPHAAPVDKRALPPTPATTSRATHRVGALVLGLVLLGGGAALLSDHFKKPGPPFPQSGPGHPPGQSPGRRAAPVVDPIPGLLKDLASEDVDLRRAAAARLAHRGANPKERHLRGALRQFGGDPAVANGAKGGGWAGAGRAHSALGRALVDPDEVVRRHATRAVLRMPSQLDGRFSPAAKAALAALNDEHPGTRQAAARVVGAGLKRPPTPGPLLDAMARLLTDDAPEVRTQAARTLHSALRKPGRFQILPGDLAHVLVPTLAKAIRAPEARREPLLLFKGLVSATRSPMLGRVLRAHAEQLLPPLRAALRVKGERSLACQILGYVGPPAAPAVPDLISAYSRAETDRERRNFIDALGSIGEPARPALPLLLEATRARDADLRRSAARALGKLGSNEEVLSALADLLQDEASAGDALAAIARLGGSLDPSRSAGAKRVFEGLMPLLSHEHPDKRRQALLTLRSFKPSPKRLALLKSALRDPSLNIRRGVVLVLTPLAKQSPAAMGVLGRTLWDPQLVAAGVRVDSSLRNLARGLDASSVAPLVSKARAPALATRTPALWTLAFHPRRSGRTPEKKPVRALFRELWEADGELHRVALFGSAQWGDPQAALLASTWLSEDKPLADRACALLVLARVYDPSPEATRRLTSFLKTKGERALSRLALDALRRLGDRAEATWPDVLELSKDSRSPVGLRRWAVRTLPRLTRKGSGPAPWSAALRRFAREESDPNLRQDAIRTLGSSRDLGARADLLTALSDRLPGVRGAALSALRRLRICDEETLSLVAALLEHKNDSTRRAAIAYLSQVEHSAQGKPRPGAFAGDLRTCEQALQRVLEEAPWPLAGRAAPILAKLPPSDRTLTALVRLLGREGFLADAVAARGAMAALATLQPAMARPVLEGLANDPRLGPLARKLLSR
jgi:HEAT repeat protein